MSVSPPGIPEKKPSSGLNASPHLRRPGAILLKSFFSSQRGPENPPVKWGIGVGFLNGQPAVCNSGREPARKTQAQPRFVAYSPCFFPSEVGEVTMASWGCTPRWSSTDASLPEHCRFTNCHCHNIPLMNRSSRGQPALDRHSAGTGNAVWCHSHRGFESHPLRGKRLGRTGRASAPTVEMGANRLASGEDNAPRPENRGEPRWHGVRDHPRVRPGPQFAESLQGRLA